ncbi:MAG: hypothetical protein ACK53L_01595, partial [Pirellulaceae bacterium]
VPPAFLAWALRGIDSGVSDSRSGGFRQASWFVPGGLGPIFCRLDLSVLLDLFRLWSLPFVISSRFGHALLSLLFLLQSRPWGGQHFHLFEGLIVHHKGFHHHLSFLGRSLPTNPL